MMNSENLIATLDQFSTAVYLKRVEGQYLSMNQTGIKLMKKSYDSVLGKTALDLFDSASATEMLESDQYVLNSGSIFTRSFNAKDLSAGTPLHIYTAKSAVVSPSGKALGIIGISIVNSKNAELFQESCKLLPKFIKYKFSNLLEELIETRTIADFFKAVNFH